MSVRKPEELQQMVGETFGKLKVIDILPTKKFHEGSRAVWRSMALCVCECGNFKEVAIREIKNGNCRSCGCQRILRTKAFHEKHSLNLAKHPLYCIWDGIRRRCNSRNSKSYERYGGRGIKVCDTWERSSAEFIRWGEENGYKKGLQIDRIDNDGDYTPSNCRFVTCTQNARNKSSNLPITYKGETMALCEWAEKLNMRRGTLRERLSRGWTVDKAIETPLRLQTIYKILLLMLLPFSAFSQGKKWYSITNSEKVIMSFQFVSGASDGLHEVLVNHPHTFERVAGWNSHYWLPKESWNNKEHMWTPISDGYHLSASINRTFNYTSIAISTGDLFSYPKKDRWKVLAKKFLLSYIANRIGFASVYNGVFNDRIERQKAGLN